MSEKLEQEEELTHGSNDTLQTMASLMLPFLGGQATLASMANDALHRREAAFRRLLAEGLPVRGLSDEVIEEFVNRLAVLDTNNRIGACGMGEREGRIFSTLVKRRHWGLAHGIGRSGNLTEVQPKAPGSTILQRLVTKMTIQMFVVAGVRLPSSWSSLLVPLATGMTLALVLRALREQRPSARFVLLSRIDQRSVVKCVALAGLEAIIIPLVVEGDGLVTDLKVLEETIHRLSPDNIVAILSTTSCFAPRLPDRILRIARLAGDIPQLVNNAYGLQSSEITRLLAQALQSSTKPVVAIVQSMDKNFMVPVGGSIIVGEASLLASIETLYPGRASLAPLLDLFITFLAMGRTGYQELLQKQSRCYALLLERLRQFQQEHPGPIRILDTPANDISIALALERPNNAKGISLGPYLFLRGISGARLLVKKRPIEDRKIMSTVPACPSGALRNFGMHHDDYPRTDAYLTVASAIGQCPDEIDTFMRHLGKFFGKRKENVIEKIKKIEI